MNTVSQTIAKLIILPLFGVAVITGVAIGTVDSAAASTEGIGWDPIAPAAPAGPAQRGHAVLDGEIAPSTSAAPARPDVILNGIRVDAEAPAPAPVAPAPASVMPPPPAAPAPASKPAAPAQQESAASDKKKVSAKSSKGNSARQ